MRESNVIRAAGGILWRKSPEGSRIAVVHRRRYGGDWVLPKGKLNEGEKWEQAALREVQEETGCTASLGEFCDAVFYEVESRPKVVLFWNMRLEREDSSEIYKEVTQLEWLSVRTAQERLTYPLEKALLDIAKPPSRAFSSTRWYQTLLKYLSGKHSTERLSHSLEIYRIEFEHRATRLGAKELSDPPVDKEAGGGSSKHGGSDVAADDDHHQSDVDSYRVTRSLLDHAEIACRAGDPNLGWRCFKAAVRSELYGFDKGLLKVCAAPLYSEVKQKLHGWRREAALRILEEGERLREDLTADHLAHAMFIMHEAQDNEYMKLSILRNHLAILSAVAIVALFLAIFSLFHLLEQTQDGTTAWKFHNVALMSFFFGVLGAAVSGILSSSKGQKKIRIPEQLSGISVTLARLAVGAGSAVIISAFLISEVIAVGNLAPGLELIVAAAFAAGFSERLVARAIAVISK